MFRDESDALWGDTKIPPQLPPRGPDSDNQETDGSDEKANGGYG